MTQAAFEPDHIGRAQVFAREHAAVRAERYLLSGSYRPHDHAFVEVAVILDGRGVHRTVHGETPLQRGATFVLRPGVWHAYLECHTLEVHNVYIAEDVLRRELAWATEDALLGRLFSGLPRSLDRAGFVAAHLDDDALQDVIAHLESLRRLSDPLVVPERAALFGHVLLLLTTLARHVTTPREPRPASSIPAAVLECIALIEADPVRAWRLRDFERHTGLNAAYLSRLFTRATGLPPLSYLARWRLERAAALVVQTERPVAEVGAAVGWLDANLFSRQFRAHFGLSPSRYRSAHRGGFGSQP